MRQTQTFECPNKIVTKQGPTGNTGPTGPPAFELGPTGKTGPTGHTGPPAPTVGLSYTQTFPGTTIQSQAMATITPTLPSNFPQGVYLVLCNMQINPVNPYKLSHVDISYSGLLSGTNYTNVTEFNE